jgi:hypothetical protein
MALRLPRVVRLDASDARVFQPAAEAGEWAVTGSFAFHAVEPANLEGKEKIAFASGWLGTESWGRASLVEVAEIGEAEFSAVIERLARHFAESYGAPSLVEALPAARAEVEDAAALADHKLGTLLAIEREPLAPGAAEPGAFKERVLVIEPQRAKDHARIWELDEGNEG